MSPRKKGGKAMKNFIWAVLAVAAVAFAVLFFAGGIDLQRNEVKIYFFRNGKLDPVSRALPEKADPRYFAVEQLLAGPSPKEKAEGFFSQIPERTRLRVLYKNGGTISADFTKDLEMYGGGATKVYGSLAQIVYTLTALKEVKDVQVLIEGKREVSLGSEGLIIDKPLTRKDVAQ